MIQIVTTAKIRQSFDRSRNSRQSYPTRQTNNQQFTNRQYGSHYRQPTYQQQGPHTAMQ